MHKKLILFQEKFTPLRRPSEFIQSIDITLLGSRRLSHGAPHSFSIALYKGQLVAVKYINIKSVTLSKRDVTELRIVG